MLLQLFQKNGLSPRHLPVCVLKDPPEIGAGLSVQASRRYAQITNLDSPPLWGSFQGLSSDFGDSRASESVGLGRPAS